MSSYLLNPNTPFFNNFILGTSQFTSPELENLVETKKIREGVELLRYKSDEQNNEINQNLRQTIAGVGHIFEKGLSHGFDRVTDGLNYLQRDLSTGLTRVDNQLETGFHNVNLNLQQGFTGVVKAISFTNEHLGNEMVRGFSNLAHRQKQSIAVMDKGFKRLVSGIAEGFSTQIQHTAYEGQLTRKAIGNLGTSLMQDNQNTRKLMQVHHEQMTGLVRHVAENMLLSERAVQQLREHMQYQHEELVGVLSGGFSQTMSLIAQEGFMTRKAVEFMRLELGEKLDKLFDELRRQNHHYKADENFILGIRYLNNLCLHDAKKEFKRALKKYSGHYASLFSMGYIAFLNNDLEKSQKWFGRALIQAGGLGDKEPQQKRERAFASLYLGRIAFTQQNYRDAHKFYTTAHSDYPKLLSALVEGAACLIMEHKGQEVKAGKRIRVHFDYINRCGYVYWFGLALELAVHHPEFALEALRQGLARHGKEKPCKRYAVQISAVLNDLNPRYSRILLDLARQDKELKWLSQYKN